MAQCTAKSKRTGKQCGRSSILGGSVCRFHGGSAPQVKRKAAERLRDLVDPSITAAEKILQAFIADDRFSREAVQIIKDVLDREIGKASDRVEISGADGGPVNHSIEISFIKPSAD